MRDLLIDCYKMNAILLSCQKNVPDARRLRRPDRVVLKVRRREWPTKATQQMVHYFGRTL
jgi:hypothetical protein